ncbi:hypothetical protein MVEN_00018200 [Mycena venus]|uniref:Uncharacterized protein n=1 Tax=Mycena venus TaxID=2733690 RepID=A0A8H6Z694_9AGAR|nr:hypothetical protein MVEN_00018200 [Mycena venus]
MTNYACVAAVEISELCAYIIDFLHNSPRDLKSCAIVSRRFTFPSQFHLFGVINLLMGPFGDPRGLRRDAAARLVEIFAETPHLSRLVRTLHAPIDSVILAHVETATADVPGFSLARDLLSRPSIHTVTLRTTFPTYAALDLLFSRCTPCLLTLNIPYTDVDSETVVSRPAAVGRRSHITNLVLPRGMAPRVASWVFDSRCPLDLSMLQRVECCVRAGPVLLLLRTASTTIVELNLCAVDITDAFPLSAFSALAKLGLMGSPRALLTAIMTLPWVARRLHLPALTRVVVSVVRRTRLAIAAAKVGADKVALIYTFGKMHALGVLVVQTEKDWGRDTW